MLLSNRNNNNDDDIQQQKNPRGKVERRGNEQIKTV